MNQRLLTVCLWISLLLHITVVLILPAPSTVEASATIAVHFSAPLEPDPVTPEVAALDEAVSEEAVSEESVPEESVPAEFAPEELPSEERSPTPPEPAEVPATASPAPPEQAATLESMTEPIAAEPAENEVAESSLQFDEAEFDEAEFDEAAVEALLKRTRDTVDGRDQEARYRLIEVRERIMRALESVHPGSSVVSGDRARYRFLLELRVDADGYIFDLGLQVPPGSDLDAGKLERAIVSISPLPAPPAGVKTPVEFQWRVDFLD